MEWSAAVSAAARGAPSSLSLKEQSNILGDIQKTSGALAPCHQMVTTRFVDQNKKSTNADLLPQLEMLRRSIGQRCSILLNY